MKRYLIIRAVQLSLVISMILTCWVTSAWAADQFEFTREIYDLMMRWVNFIILAALIIKYARRPIANFLKDRQNDVAKAIEKLETQKEAANNQLQVYQKQLTASEDRLVGIKQKIIAEGEVRKAHIIATAQEESRIMLETAKLRIDHMIRETQGHIKSELIDTAAEIALTKLSSMMTTEDHDKLVRQWMDAVQN